jgi:hypothetical protein
MFVSVRLSLCIQPINEFPLKFYIGKFYEKFLAHFQVSVGGITIMTAVHEDVPAFLNAWAFGSLCCARTHRVDIPVPCMHSPVHAFWKREFGLYITYMPFLRNGSLLCQKVCCSSVISTVLRSNVIRTPVLGFERSKRALNVCYTIE